MKLSQTELAEIICTRLSHDLIGNIGAVSNALELLEDDEDSLTEIKPILELSARTLTARLKFFRLAFGLDNAAPRTVDELKIIAEQYLVTIGGRSCQISLDFQVATPQLYKIILPAIMALSDVFVHGGTLKVMEQNRGINFEVLSDSALSASKLKTQSELLQGIMSEENPSQTAPLLYLQRFLQDKGAEMKLAYDVNRAVLAIG